MADSTEDLKREMEEFERGEDSEDELLSTAPVETQLASRRRGRTLPTWIYWMIVGDILIVTILLFIFVF